MGRLDNYEEVKDRLPRFWKAVDRGRITTEILNHNEDFSRVVIKASLWDGDSLLATGIAMDWKDKDRNANRTNWVEVAETSAIGRAIANSRFQDPNAARPSKEEMEVAFERQDALDCPSDPSKSQESDNKPAWIVQLETRFGRNEGKVTNFYLGKGAIKKGQTWRDVPPETAKKLQTKTEEICKHLGI